MSRFKTQPMLGAALATLLLGLNAPDAMAGLEGAGSKTAGLANAQARMSERHKARSRMSKRVRELADSDSGRPEMVEVLVAYKNRAGQAETARITGLGGQHRRAYDRLGMRLMRVPAHALKRLAENDNIEVVALDEPVQAFSLAARETARLPEAGSPDYVSVDPSVGVAVLDSGVGQHADLNVAMQVDIIPASDACSESFRDAFNTAAFSGNDGSSPWKGDWVEDDAAGAGPSSGNVTISGGELLLDDRPNTGTQPGAARAADLSQAGSATFSFDFRTGSGVEANEDRIAVDVSADGGLSYTTLEIFETYEGAVSGSRSYDLSPYLSADTTIRFRVYDRYGGPSEYFAVDNVEIAAETCDPRDPFGHGTHVGPVST